MSNPQGVLRTLLGLKQPGEPGRIIVWDTGEITVGRASENDIVLQDTDASRQHALLYRTAQGFYVKDLGTSNGTLVNDVAIREPVLLENKHVVTIGELQLTFIQTRKDPSTLGLEVSYSSQLKGFAHPANGADPGATTLGLTAEVGDDFAVGAVGDFDAPIAPPAATRDLDLEFDDGPGESKLASASASTGALSLTLELTGLTPDLEQALRGWMGKQIELPKLRIRIKGE